MIIEGSIPGQDEKKVPWKAFRGAVEKPGSFDFGYYLDDEPFGCSLERLVEVCRENKAVVLVWTPDSPYVVTTEEVPFLIEVHRSRANWDAWVKIVVGALVLALVLAIMEGGVPRFGSGGFLFLGVSVFFLGSGLWDLVRKQQLTSEEVARAAPRSWYFLWLRKQSRDFTWWMIGCIGAVACMQVAASDSIASAGLVKAAVLGGEVWRLLTAPLLHVRPSHLYWNLTALYALGQIVEAHSPKRWLPAIFTVSAIVGSVFSLVLPPDKTSVGASGGILGLAGFLCVLVYRRDWEFPAGFFKAVLLMIALNAGLGLLGFTFIDNAAHLGGFLAGLLLGVWLIPIESTSEEWRASGAAAWRETLFLWVLVAMAGFTILAMFLPMG